METGPRTGDSSVNGDLLDVVDLCWVVTRDSSESSELIRTGPQFIHPYQVHDVHKVQLPNVRRCSVAGVGGVVVFLMQTSVATVDCPLAIVVCMPPSDTPAAPLRAEPA